MFDFLRKSLLIHTWYHLNFIWIWYSRLLTLFWQIFVDLTKAFPGTIQDPSLYRMAWWQITVVIRILYFCLVPADSAWSLWKCGNNRNWRTICIILSWFCKVLRVVHLCNVNKYSMKTKIWQKIIVIFISFNQICKYFFFTSRGLN